MRDYHALAGFHYRGKPPLCAARVFALEFDFAGFDQQAGRFHLPPNSPVAVVAYTHPVPDCRARDLATGGRYVGWPDRRSGLLLLNREMRTVSRLIVEPRFRGLGLATRLLRETLPRLNVPLVEALAVMGELVPMFTRAGFERVTNAAATPYFLWRKPLRRDATRSVVMFAATFASCVSSTQRSALLRG